MKQVVDDRLLITFELGIVLLLVVVAGDVGHVGQSTLDAFNLLTGLAGARGVGRGG